MGVDAPQADSFDKCLVFNTTTHAVCVHHDGDMYVSGGTSLPCPCSGVASVSCGMCQTARK